MPGARSFALHKPLFRHEAEVGSLAAVLLDEFRRGLDRDVHGVVGPVQKERPVRITLADERHRFVSQTVGQVLADRSVVQIRHVVRAEIAVLRHTPAASGDVHVEAVPVWRGRAVTQMPLSHVPRLVAAIPERPGERILTLWQGMEVRDVGQPPYRVPGDILGHPNAGGVLAAHDAGPGGRADGAGRVRRGEAHALIGERVEIRGLVEVRPVTGQVPPPQIVDEYEDDIWPFSHGASLSVAPCRVAAPCADSLAPCPLPGPVSE